jgi:hypothetical protein
VGVSEKRVGPLPVKRTNIAANTQGQEAAIKVTLSRSTLCAALLVFEHMMIQLMERAEMPGSVLAFFQNGLSNISIRDGYLKGPNFRYHKQHVRLCRDK